MHPCQEHAEEVDRVSDRQTATGATLLGFRADKQYGYGRGAFWNSNILAGVMQTSRRKRGGAMSLTWVTLCMSDCRTMAMPASRTAWLLVCEAARFNSTCTGVEL